MRGVVKLIYNSLFMLVQPVQFIASSNTYAIASDNPKKAVVLLTIKKIYNVRKISISKSKFYLMSDKTQSELVSQSIINNIK